MQVMILFTNYIELFSARQCLKDVWIHAWIGFKQPSVDKIEQSSISYNLRQILNISVSYILGQWKD